MLTMANEIPIFILVAFLVGACGGGGGGAAVVNQGCSDADGDGYGVECDAGPDCDDGNANVHSGMSEIYYDSINNDCDASTFAIRSASFRIAAGGWAAILR